MTKPGLISVHLLFSDCPVGWTGGPASKLRHHVYGETGQHIKGNAKCWSCLYSTCWEDLFFTILYKDSTTDQKSPQRPQQIWLTTTDLETKLHTLHRPAIGSSYTLTLPKSFASSGYLPGLETGWTKRASFSHSYLQEENRLQSEHTNPAGLSPNRNNNKKGPEMKKPHPQKAPEAFNYLEKMQQKPRGSPSRALLIFFNPRGS